MSKHAKKLVQPGPRGPRYAPSVRLQEFKAMLAAGGVTIPEAAERLGVSYRTALRLLQALMDLSTPLDWAWDGRQKRWRIAREARTQTIDVRDAEVVSLILVRHVLDFLQGTGIKEDFDQFLGRLDKQISRKRRDLAKNLDRKILDLNETPHQYADRAEDVDALVMGLLGEQRVEFTDRDRTRRLLDPYTLVLYKKGLYVIGYSHHHSGVRTFSLDDLRDLDWRKGDRFDYPTRYDPRDVVPSGAFGLIPGPETHVRVFFPERKARFIRRRSWHPTQKIRNVEGGVVLSMVVRGTTELLSWLLSWGAEAEVLEPQSLRDELAREIAKMASHYAGPPSSLPRSSGR